MIKLNDEKRNAAIIAALNDEGQTPLEVSRKIGNPVALPRFKDLMRHLADTGRIYKARVSEYFARQSGRKYIVLYFRTPEARDRVQADLAEKSRKHKAAQQAKARKAKARANAAATEQRRQEFARRKAERELLRKAAAEKRASEAKLREEMRKLREELAAARKAAKTTTRKNFVDQCIVQRRSAEEREAIERRQRAADAMRSAEAIIPAHVKVQILPGTPANRWAVEVPKSRLSDPIGETRSWVDALVR